MSSSGVLLEPEVLFNFHERQFRPLRELRLEGRRHSAPQISVFNKGAKLGSKCARRGLPSCQAQDPWCTNLLLAMLNLRLITKVQRVRNRCIHSGEIRAGRMYCLPASRALKPQHPLSYAKPCTSHVPAMYHPCTNHMLYLSRKLPRSARR